MSAAIAERLLLARTEPPTLGELVAEEDRGLLRLKCLDGANLAGREQGRAGPLELEAVEPMKGPRRRGRLAAGRVAVPAHRADRRRITLAPPGMVRSRGARPPVDLNASGGRDALQAEAPRRFRPAGGSCRSGATGSAAWSPGRCLSAQDDLVIETAGIAGPWLESRMRVTPFYMRDGVFSNRCDRADRCRGFQRWRELLQEPAR